MARKGPAKPTPRKSDGTVVRNRRATFNYEIIERFEAGIVLSGSEIKSIREGKVDIQGAYARFIKGELWLHDMNIAPYAHAGYTPHDPRRDRKLLLHKREIRHLSELIQQKGLTIIPLRLYLKGGRAKVELGVGRGLKKYDKRQKIKEREESRQVARLLRHSA